jgi:uncharacterized membrane protein YjfL (UPF0719 family)
MTEVAAIQSFKEYLEQIYIEVVALILNDKGNLKSTWDKVGNVLGLVQILVSSLDHIGSLEDALVYTATQLKDR